MTAVKTEATCPTQINQLAGYVIAPEQIHWAAEPCMSLSINALDGQRINLTLFDFSSTQQLHPTGHHDRPVSEVSRSMSC